MKETLSALELLAIEKFLEDKFNENYDGGRLSLALSDCKQLANISEELGKVNLKKEFIEKSIEIQQRIDELKEKLHGLFKEGLEFLNEDDLEGAISKAKEISDFIKEHQY